MENANVILIADRNPHIRGFLRRELSACGYHVRLVKTGKELLKEIYSRTPVDLLVLDPDFPGVDSTVMAQKIEDRIPQLPVVLYCIRETDNLSDCFTGNVFHLEKNGQSIEVLKEIIQQILAGAAICTAPSTDR
jgi:DNA-binding NtrC family response regulator